MSTGLAGKTFRTVKGQTRTETEPQLRMMELKANEQAARRAERPGSDQGRS
jgi:hypothetical protein